MQEFKLPDLGEGMQEAEIRRWLIQPGDTIKLDQPMVEVETDKAVVEIPAPIAGRVARIHVPEGQTAKLGEILITFESSTNPAPPTRAANGANSPAVTASTGSITAAQVAAAPAASTEGTASSGPPARILAAPAVRKRAFELGIDLAQITPSQHHGRITLEDVLSFAKQSPTGSPSVGSPAAQPHLVGSPPLRGPMPTSNGASQLIDAPSAKPSGEEQQAPPAPSAPAEERQPLAGLRKRIAERMERSWRTVPHATAFDELDGGELVTLRQVLKPVAEQRGVRLTYMPLLVKLLIPVLKEFPIFNASLDEEKREIIYKRVYHIGIAADSPEGLLVPVLRNADQLTVLQIASQLEHLIAGAQKRTLSLSEIAGSTFTLNNVGSFGGSGGTPIINYPEVAILAVGRLQEKAIVRNGSIIARTMMPISLSFDHRLIDGALAGKFLARFKDLVEHPQQLLLDLV